MAGAVTARHTLYRQYVVKAKSDEELRLEALIAKQEAKVRRAFALFVATVKSDVVMAQVADYLERGALEAALEIVDQYVVRLANVVPDVFIASAQAEVQALSAQIEAGGGAVSFDPTNPEAARLMRDQRLEFVREVSTAQRDAIRTALAEAYLTGAGPLESARVFRDAVGLTQHQIGIVANYRRLLQDGDREALGRALRDRRFDRTVDAAIRRDRPLTPEQIDRMVDRYRTRFVAYRGETIARTESGRVLEAARDVALAQTMAQTGLEDTYIERTWRATFDKRTRDTHRAMNGQKVIGAKTKFVSPSGARLLRPHDPEAPKEETIACRCQVTTRIRRRSEVEGR